MILGRILLQDDRLQEIGLDDALVGADDLPAALPAPGLGDPDDVDVDQVQARHDLPHAPELAAPAVDDDEIRELALGDPSLEAPGEHLLEGREVVAAGLTADAIAAVAVLVGQAPGERHPRAHRLAAAEMRDVVALDDDRRVHERELLLE